MRTSLFSFLLIFSLTVAACGSAKPPVTPPTALPASAPPLAAERNNLPERQAVFVTITNQVESRASDAESFAQAEVGQNLPAGGEARTGDASKARLDMMPEGTIVRVGPNSIFALSALSDSVNEPPLTTLRLLTGQLWIVLNGGDLQVETEFGNAGVRGSYLSIALDPANQSILVTCLEGACFLENAAGRVDLTDGQASEIMGKAAPSPARPMTPEEYESWDVTAPESLKISDPQAYAMLENHPPATHLNTQPLTYNFANACMPGPDGNGGGTWTITLTRLSDANGGMLSESIVVPPGGSAGGILPPGQYIMSQTAPGGDSHETVIDSDSLQPGGTACGDMGGSGASAPLQPGSNPMPGGGMPPPPGGDSSTGITKYSLTNNCTNNDGDWIWTFEGAETITVVIPQGQTVSGELPAGDYYVTDVLGSRTVTTGNVPGGGEFTVSACPNN